jgi:hypothetical protein
MLRVRGVGISLAVASVVLPSWIGPSVAHAVDNLPIGGYAVGPNGEAIVPPLFRGTTPLPPPDGETTTSGEIVRPAQTYSGQATQQDCQTFGRGC